MNKMIVAVFDSEEKAFEGLTALKTLHKSGDISLYATAVLAKNEEGEVAMKQVSDKGPIGTSVGMLSGAFIGILAGPVGMAVGATAGMFGGMYYDLSESGFDDGFVDEVSKALQNGKTAVIADVDEGWTAPVDTRMEELDGMVFRKNRSEVVDDQLNREAEALNAELDELEEELKEADEQAKASIQKQIDKAKKKSKAIKDVVDKKLADAKAETEAKTKELDAQLKEAGSHRKKKLEKRKAELKASMKARDEKLSKVSETASKYMMFM
jgi:uncharacterized membrane protein